ncbi:MAG: reverse transcriptase family protein [Candidatus Thiodiazotropha sp.]
MIDIEIFRMRIGLHYSRHCRIKGLEHLDFFESLVIMALLLLAGVEPNPGPISEASTSSSNLSLDLNDIDMIKDKFSVVHYNVQSISNKIDILESELSNFDIICLTETWLDGRTSNDTISLKEYNLYRRDRVGDNHGGICVYVKQNVHSRRRHDIELPNIECVWVEVSTHNKKILLGTFYRPPNSTQDVLSSIEDSISLAYDTNIQNILINGDFNLDILKSACNRKVFDLCQHFSLNQFINEPTHYTESSSSIIDLFFTSNINSILHGGVGQPILDQNIRYHCPVYCILNFDKPITPIYSRHIWLYDRGDYLSLSRDLDNTDWSALKSDDIDTYTNNVTERITELAKKHIPNKDIKVRKSDPPWLTTNIKRLMRKRKRLYDKYKKSKNINDFETYKNARNKVTFEIRQSKQKQLDKLTEKLKSNDLNQKDWWKTLKYFITPEQQSTLPPLCKDDIIYTNENDKANILNLFFTEQTILDDSNATLPTVNQTPPHKLESISITSQEVEDVLKSLKTGKAAGPDSIDNRLLKELAQPLCAPLADLFNFSIAKGKVPNLWKQANVTPVFKKNDPSDVSNYRPISLLNTLGKVLEKIVHKYVFNFLNDHHVITTLQSGFVPGDSTVNQLVDIYNTFCRALDEGKEVRAIFCDISKAFDRVWHKGLLFKLHSVGISGSLLQWFTDYLANRKQRVVIPGASSNWSSVQAGVPQGSILGPLLFLLYINDIVENINSSIRLFADDTTLYIIVDNPVQAAYQLNSDLSKIHQWANQWLVTFNPSKSESVIFSRKRNRPNHPQVLMDQEPIQDVNLHKHLGIIFSNDCTWHDHLEYIKSKAWTRINVMRKLKFKLDRKSLQIIYFTFIRPILEYADVVWSNCTQYEINELEKIQNEAARIVSGATKLVSINALIHECGWETLLNRRKKHKLLLFYKMQNSLSPNYLSSLVPPTIGNTTSYPLRNSSDLLTVHASSQLYYNSFLPSVIREWNELPEDVRNLPSIATFKHELNSDILKIPTFYFDGSRLGQIYHARLRTNCSSLNQHLFSKNIIDSPLCACQAVEDTNHFLFNCERFRDLRQELFNKITPICQPTLNILLFGSEQLTDIENRQIFTAVQEFLVRSKRFEIV